jgi:DNA invertase Pin-like site-specific DNA recombinase
MNIFSYDRVSSSEQEKEGINLKIKKEKYQKLGLSEANMFADGGISGGFSEIDEVKIRITSEEFIVSFPIKKRPEFNKLIQKLNVTPNSKLIFSKYDRISRSSSFGDLFFIWMAQKGIEWEALEDIDTHQSPAMRRFLLAWANDRRDNDATNIASQRKNLFDADKWSVKSVIGYIKTKEGRLELDPEKARMIKNIFNMTLDGKNYKEICEKWDIHPAQYYRIIKNKTYCGYINYKGQWKKSDSVPAIITEEEFYKANASPS